MRLKTERKFWIATSLKAARLHNRGKLGVYEKQTSCSRSCVATKGNFPHLNVLLQTSLPIPPTRKASVYIAPGSSPRQAAQAASSASPGVSAGANSPGEVLELSNSFLPQRFFFLTSILCHILVLCIFPESTVLTIRLSDVNTLWGRDFILCCFCVRQWWVEQTSTLFMDCVTHLMLWRGIVVIKSQMPFEQFLYSRVSGLIGDDWNGKWFMQKPIVFSHTGNR